MDRLLTVVNVMSIALFLLVLISVRRERIRVEYSVSWLAAAIFTDRENHALNGNRDHHERNK